MVCTTFLGSKNRFVLQGLLRVMACGQTTSPRSKDDNGSHQLARVEQGVEFLEIIRAVDKKQDRPHG